MRLVLVSRGDAGGATLSVADSVLVELVGARCSALQVAPSVVLNEDSPTCCSVCIECPNRTPLLAVIPVCQFAHNLRQKTSVFLLLT